MPEAPALPHFGQAIINLAALLGRKHLGGIANGLREALAGGVGEAKLLGSQRFDCRSIYSRLRQQLSPALARGERLLSHWH
jgi:hypothetical protein